MKCLCGYEYKDNCIDPVIGDEPFIKLSPHDLFKVEPPLGSFEYSYSVNLFVCPKCQTVRMDKWS